MRNKNLALQIAGALLGLIAAAHLLRSLFNVSVVIGNWAVPQQLSLWVFVVFGLISAWLLWQGGRP